MSLYVIVVSVWVCCLFCIAVHCLCCCSFVSLLCYVLRGCMCVIVDLFGCVVVSSLLVCLFYLLASCDSCLRVLLLFACVRLEWFGCCIVFCGIVLSPPHLFVVWCVACVVVCLRVLFVC